MRGISRFFTERTIATLSLLPSSSTLKMRSSSTVIVTATGSICWKPYFWIVYVPGAILTVAVSLPAASSSAACTALNAAVLETVAPAMPSISALCAATICSGSSSIALEPMPRVSLSPTSDTASIFPSDTLTVAVTSPPKPGLTTVYVPSVYAVSAEASNGVAAMHALRHNAHTFFIPVSSFLLLRG